jgi:hypothetical protein
MANSRSGRNPHPAGTINLSLHAKPNLFIPGTSQLAVLARTRRAVLLIELVGNENLLEVV